MLHIPEASPSRNEFHHKFWRVEWAAKRRWHNMLAIAAMRAKATPATGKREVTIERYGKRKLDADNFVGGLKGPIDCLKKLGLLIDDDDKHALFHFVQMPLGRGLEPYTVITLEEFENKGERK